MSRKAIALLVLLPLLAAADVARAQAVALKVASQIYRDASGVGLRFPEGVACNGTMLAVADTGNSRVLLFAIEDGRPAPGPVLTIPETPRPIRLAFRPDGGLLVLDGRSRRIARVDATGAFEGWLEPAVSGPVVPRSVKVGANGATFVLDVGRPRVLVLDGDGALQREVFLPDGVSAPADLAVAASGEIWVVDGIGSALYASAEATATSLTRVAALPRDRLELAHALTLDRAGRLLVVDRSGGRLGVLGRDGAVRELLLSMGWSAGQLRYPGAACADANGLLFVADRENHRVQVFSLGE